MKKQRRNVIFIISLILGGLILTTSAWWLTYRPNPIAEIYSREDPYAMEVAYSDNLWDLNLGDDYPPSELTGTRDLIQLIAKDQNAPAYRTNVMFKIEQVDQADQSLSQYTDTQTFRINQLRTFEVEDKNPITVNGESAYEIIYSGDDGEYPLKRRRVILAPKRDSDVPYFHLITYTSEIENYEKHLEAFNDVLQSVVLK